MKIIYDGIISDEMHGVFSTLFKHIPDMQVCYSHNFIDDFKMLKHISKEDRMRIYMAFYESANNSFTFNTDPYSDALMCGSLLSAYVVERLIDRLSVSVPAENLLAFVPLGENALSLIDFICKNTDSKAVFYIACYPLERLAKILRSPAKNCALFGTLPNSIDKIQQKIQISCGFDALMIVHSLYNEAYELIRNNKRHFKIYRIDPDFLKNYFLDIQIAVDSVDIKEKMTVLVDIDDVLINFNEENTKKLQNRDSDDAFKDECHDYFLNGELSANFYRVMAHIDEYMSKEKIGRANIVILTARNSDKDKAFLNIFADEFNRLLKDYDEGLEYLHFNKKTNILSNPSSIYNGSTFFKGYALNLFLSKICKKFSNKNKNGILFIDDRIKYAKAAFHNFQFTNNNADASYIKSRACKLKTLKIGNKIVYAVSSFKKY